MTDDETCVSFGCDREARNDEHCEPCRTAFEAGYHKAQEDNGVRGREEVREKLEELEDEIENFSGYDDKVMNRAKQFAEQHKRACEWFLGVRDSL